MSHAKSALEMRCDLPHLTGVKPPSAASGMMEAPHWGHWQHNLNYSSRKMTNMMASGKIPPAPPEPWATDKQTGGGPEFQ